jgi:hypothetical protein
MFVTLSLRNAALAYVKASAKWTAPPVAPALSPFKYQLQIIASAIIST